MTDTDNTDTDDQLAAEYVLSLLPDAEQRTFEDRLLAEAPLRRMVFRWEDDLARLAEALPEVPAPASLRARILQSIRGAQVIPFWRRPPVFMSGLAAASLLAAAVLFTTLSGPDLTPEFRAELVNADQNIVLVAEVIPATHEIVIATQSGAPVAGRVFELWLIADGAPVPVSLGVLDASGQTTIRVPDEIAPGVRTGTIAISDEPLGGSPTGQPTGDILATATFVDI